MSKIFKEPVRICTTCKITKDICEFTRRRISKGGINLYKSICRECNRINNQIKRNTPEGKIKIRKIKLKRDYGITLEQFNQMLIYQDYKCAICGNPEITIHNNSKKIQNLAVDHNHITNKIRGLLCKKCNLLIANADENIFILQNAINYINKWNK